MASLAEGSTPGYATRLPGVVARFRGRDGLALFNEGSRCRQGIIDGDLGGSILSWPPATQGSLQGAAGASVDGAVVRRADRLSTGWVGGQARAGGGRAGLRAVGPTRSNVGSGL